MFQVPTWSILSYLDIIDYIPYAVAYISDYSVTIHVHCLIPSLFSPDSSPTPTLLNASSPALQNGSPLGL